MPDGGAPTTHSPTREHNRYEMVIDTEILHDGEVYPARTRNLSRGGLCVAVPLPLPTNVVVDVSLSLVSADERFSGPLLMRARVVWCTLILEETEERYQIGVAFLSVTNEQRACLDVYLCFLRNSTTIPAMRDPDEDGF